MTQDNITEDNLAAESAEDSIEGSALDSEATENATDIAPEAVIDSVSLGGDAELLAVFDDDDDDDDEEEEIEPSPYDRPGRW